MKYLAVILVICLWAAPMAWAQDTEKASYLEDRMEMVETQIAERGVKDPAVLSAMKTVPRHQFVPPAQVGSAYRDQPLPIGYGQTISQPYIVAYMTEILNLKGDERVLEIGTGSGYQAAVLAECTAGVYSVEIIPELHQSAGERLARLGYEGIDLKEGDGYFGWEEHAPYDAIIVTCAAGHIPPPLIQQLKPGGRMIIPVGSVWSVQSLVLAEKEASGRIKTRNLMAVRFVPLVRPSK